MITLSPKRALISVSDKTGIVEFAKQLDKYGIQIISTGGTSKALTESGIKVTKVSDITQFEEIMNGRVKTLHPRIHGGILGKRDTHQADADKYNIEWIDMVVCNLYPFEKTIAGEHTYDQAVENIDIGGPAMIRAAAKNHHDVCIITDPSDFNQVITELEKGISFETRKTLAAKAFSHTAHYDSMITNYLNDRPYPQELTLGYRKKQTLRYGENPHQSAAWYIDANNPFEHQIQGKELSFNNINDASAALQCVSEFDAPTCVVVKHANPCGVASAQRIEEAFSRAWAADSKSAFGGIVALNRPCTKTIANILTGVFIEIILAPGFSEEALELFATKPNVRLLQISDSAFEGDEYISKCVQGGLLIQARDTHNITEIELNCPTQIQAEQSKIDDCQFGWRVLKHIKSNGILIANDLQTLGVGAGQVSRVDAVELAIEKAGSIPKGAILASDAFFPFADSIELIAQTPVKTIIQPGGSIRDKEVIEACNQHGISMLMTGMRCFNH